MGWGGVGWGGVGMILHMSLASLLDFPLNFMLRYMIFPWFSCYATGSMLR